MAEKQIPQGVKKIINEYIQVLKADRLPIQRVLLYGSYAKGKHHQWSDVDLCVISPKFKNPWQATQYLWSKRIFSRKATIEPIGMTLKDFRRPSSLTQEIKRTGIKIKI